MPYPNERKIPPQVIKRLPRYYRHLGELLACGIYRTSSGALAERMGLTASQIRQDLNCFGGFGQQGYGYNVKYLYSQIAELLGVNDKFRAIILGVGGLGRALAESDLFFGRGIRLLGFFDPDDAVTGRSVAGYAVYPAKELSSFLVREPVDIAVLTADAGEAMPLAGLLDEAGVRGIWNVSGVELSGLQKAHVVNMALADSLLTLSYRIKNHENGSADAGTGDAT